MIGQNNFATFHKKGWPDLTIPIKLESGGHKGTLFGGNFLEFEYTVAWDTDYVFRKDDGSHSQIDGTCTMTCPDVADGTPVTLTVPIRRMTARTAEAYFNVESPS